MRSLNSDHVSVFSLTLYIKHRVEETLMRLICLWPQTTGVFLIIQFTSARPCLFTANINKKTCQTWRLCLKHHSCPTKPWSFQIQYFFSGLEPRAGPKNSLRCLIHAMKSMLRPVSACDFISLSGQLMTAGASPRPRRCGGRSNRPHWQTGSGS